jgi:hypothetical protein
MSLIIEKHLDLLSKLGHEGDISLKQAYNVDKYILPNPELEVKSIIYIDLGHLYISNIPWEQLNKEDSHYYYSLMTISSGMTHHSNAIYIDTWLKTIERFDPNGPTVYGDLDKQMKNEADKHGYQYIKPRLYMSIGPQCFDPRRSGFCRIWTSIYIILRMAEPDISLMDLVLGMNRWSQRCNQIKEEGTQLLCRFLGQLI